MLTGQAGGTEKVSFIVILNVIGMFAALLWKNLVNITVQTFYSAMIFSPQKHIMYMYMFFHIGQSQINVLLYVSFIARLDCWC